MQLKSMKRPENPKLLVDKIAKHFMRAVARAERKGSNQIEFKATSVMKSKKQTLLNAMKSPGGTNINPYPLLTKDEKINEKVLQIARETIREPSKTTQKLTDLG